MVSEQALDHVRENDGAEDGECFALVGCWL